MLNLETKYSMLISILEKTEQGNDFMADIKKQSKEVETIKQDKICIQEQLDNLTLTILILQNGGIK